MMWFGEFVQRLMMARNAIKDRNYGDAEKQLAELISILHQDGLVTIVKVGEQ